MAAETDIIDLQYQIFQANEANGQKRQYWCPTAERFVYCCNEGKKYFR